MNSDDLRVKAEVHVPITGGYRLKVFVYGLGIYINGWQVYAGKGNRDRWVNKPPYYTVKGKPYYPLEFDKKGLLWRSITAACNEAAWEEDKNRGINNPFKKIKRPEL